MVFQLEVLVGELGSVDGQAASAGAVGEVSSLGHEASDDPVEVRLLVGVTLLVVASAKGSEVLCGLGAVVLIELHGDLTEVLPIAGDLEEDLGVSRVGIVHGAEARAAEGVGPGLVELRFERLGEHIVWPY